MLTNIKKYTMMLDKSVKQERSNNINESSELAGGGS